LDEDHHEHKITVITGKKTKTLFCVWKERAFVHLGVEEKRKCILKIKIKIDILYICSAFGKCSYPFPFPTF
jgi:hypothetical protein